MTVLATPAGNVSVARDRDPFSSGHPDTRWWAGPGLTALVGFQQSITYAGLYRTQPWLAACVNKIKNMIARLPLKSFEEAPDGSVIQLHDHPIPKVFRFPNPRLSPFRLKEWIFGDLALYGNSVTRIIWGPDGQPEELWPLPWPLIEVVGKRDPLVYIYHSPLGPIPFTSDECIHLRFWNPAGYWAMAGFWSPSGSWSVPGGMHPLVGNSPVEPLRRTLMNEDAAGRWSTALFANSGQPSAVVSTDQKMNKDQIDLTRKELEGLYGGVDNAFRIAVMQGGLKWQPVSLTALDAALIELRKLNREECAAAYDIPPPMIQILDKATFSNVSEQHRNLYQDSLPPWMVLFEDEMYTQLIAKAPGNTNIRTQFDMTEVLRPAHGERAAYFAQARRWMMIDEIRQAADNLGPLANGAGQVVMVPINEYPLGQGPPPKDALPAMSILLNALDRAEQYASSRLGAGKKAFDPERFARELCGELGRDDDPAIAWATSVGRAVDAVIESATTPTELKGRMATLREVIARPADEPPELPAPEPALNGSR